MENLFQKGLRYFIVAIFGFAALLFLGLVFYCVDEGFGKETPCIGVVKGRHHTESYTTNTMTGEVMTTTYHPAQYYLTVEGPHGLVSVNASEEAYNSIPDGQAWHYTETKGCISGTVYTN